MNREIWIWQYVLSPHTAGLAAALAARGHRVKYIVQRMSLSERELLGWTIPSLGQADLVHCPSCKDLTILAASATARTAHVFQGLRGNGHLACAYKTLRHRNIPFWVLMETLDDRGWRGIVRRVLYRQLLSRWKPHICGILAIGRTTPAWLVARGMPVEQLSPFTYFLPDQEPHAWPLTKPTKPFKVMFVGNLIERKGLDILLNAMVDLVRKGSGPDLVVVGSGPEEGALRDTAERLELKDRVHWLGSRKIEEIPALMATADLFVLPSRFDGWGAVVSEALMAGTPAITTDHCGAAEAVKASRIGAVVPAGNAAALRYAIASAAKRGPVPADVRALLAGWASAFGATKGAEYLSNLIETYNTDVPAPHPPWIAMPAPDWTEHFPPLDESRFG